MLRNKNNKQVKIQSEVQNLFVAVKVFFKFSLSDTVQDVQESYFKESLKAVHFVSM